MPRLPTGSPLPVDLMPDTVPSRYIGRFAPTPSGHLHFGSLIAALASYLDAKAVNGLWLLRMEDLDGPREVPGAQDAILRTLEHYGFEWDGPVIRQSQRQAAYQEAAAWLQQQGLAYFCTCSRKHLEAWPGAYPGFCRHAGHGPQDAALRLRVPERSYAFVDRVQGAYQQQLAQQVGDFVIQRRDGVFAYQLAVVVDDAWQGITDVVRGADLLDSTPRQLYLQEVLGLAQPRYLHLPLIIQADGHKLSKSRQAPPLQSNQAAYWLWQALRALGQQPPPELAHTSPHSLLQWGIQQWQATHIPTRLSLAETDYRLP